MEAKDFFEMCTIISLLLLTLIGYSTSVPSPVRNPIPLIEDRKMMSSYSTNVGKMSTFFSNFVQFLILLLKGSWYIVKSVSAAAMGCRVRDLLFELHSPLVVEIRVMISVEIIGFNLFIHTAAIRKPNWMDYFHNGFHSWQNFPFSEMCCFEKHIFILYGSDTIMVCKTKSQSLPSHY